VREDGETPPPETLLCGRCATACDPEDNFCRHCGLALHEHQLPSVRDGQQVPAVWQPPLPAAVVKGAAFVAAGTLAEILVRRLVRGVLRGRSRASQAPARRAKSEVAPREEPLPAETQMLSETLLLRRVRFRR
jgi:hypothetical protein